jgi:hypothetical protein
MVKRREPPLADGFEPALKRTFPWALRPDAEAVEELWNKSLAPMSSAPTVSSAPKRVAQLRDAGGRFMRQLGPRTVPDRKNDCLLWLGPMKGGVPYDAGHSQLARIYEEAYGEPLPPHCRILRTCGQSRCIAQAHLYVLDPEDARLYRFAANETRWLTSEEVAEAHALAAALAEKFGISIGTLTAYMRHPVSFAGELPDPRPTP